MTKPDYQVLMDMGQPIWRQVPWPAVDLLRVRAVRFELHGSAVEWDVPPGYVPVFRFRTILDPVKGPEARLAFLALHAPGDAAPIQVHWALQTGPAVSSGYQDEPPYHPPELYPHEAALLA